MKKCGSEVVFGVCCGVGLQLQPAVPREFSVSRVLQRLLPVLPGGAARGAHALQVPRLGGDNGRRQQRELELQ